MALVIIASFQANASLDIPLHDTYFVTSRLQSAGLLAIMLGLMGLGYRWLGVRRMTIWTALHIGGTILWSLLIVIPSVFMTDPARRYYQYESIASEGIEEWMDLSRIITLTTLLFLLSQIIFLGTLVLKVLRR